jgi:hypothetical protein
MVGDEGNVKTAPPAPLDTKGRGLLLLMMHRKPPGRQSPAQASESVDHARRAAIRA